MTCRTCRYLKVAPNAAGKIIPRKGKAYFCSFPKPDLTGLLPASMKIYPHSIHASYMEPDDGATCQKHEPRT